MVKAIKTDEQWLKAEIYTEILNDRQARIMEFISKYPEADNTELLEVNKQLSVAHRESRFKVSDEYFKKWDDLILHADTALTHVDPLKRKNGDVLYVQKEENQSNS